MITYDQIINDLNYFKLNPIKVINVVEKNGLIVRENTAVQFYAAPICKDDYLDLAKRLFHGRDLNISYNPNDYMINIEIPVVNNELHPLFQTIINNSLLS